MRSLSLQKQFSGTYHEFFMEHDLVVSAPHTLRWGYGLTNSQSRIGIQQQLPAKMYCGVNVQDSPGVIIESISMFDPITEQFELYEPDQCISPQHKEALQKTLKNLLEIYGFSGGMTIGLLCEYKRGEGFGFMGTLSVLLGTVVLLMSKQISVEQVNSTRFHSLPAFGLVQQIALYLDAQCLSNSGGAEIAATLADHGLPVAQISQPNISELPRSSEEDKISPARYFFGLQELSQTSLAVDELPIDYGVISFGVNHDRSAVEHAYQQSYRLLTESYDRLMEVRYERLPRESLPPLIGSSALTRPWDSFLYAHLLEHWEEILTCPGDHTVIDKFIQGIIDCGLYHLMIEKEVEQFFQLYAWFDELKNFSHEKIGLLPISTAKAGGSILFVTHRSISQGTMEQLLHRLRQRYRHVRFSYLSWRDGFSSTGMHVEQFLGQDIFSSYVLPGSVVFKGGDGRRYVATHPHILQREQAGVLLDNVYGKVYCDGHKTNYRQLRSQSGTTSIISLLLQSLGKYVPHTLFPTSSYSANKNELTSKIIAPFDALLQKKYGASLPVEYIGGVYDFAVKLTANPNGLIHLISKVEDAAREEVKDRAI